MSEESGRKVLKNFLSGEGREEIVFEGRRGGCPIVGEKREGVSTGE